MLKGISPIITADLLWVLRAMGHGDDLALVDRNFPAQSVAKSTSFGRPVVLSGVDIPTAVSAILHLYPLDTFVDTPVHHMQVVGEPDTRVEVHDALYKECQQAHGAEVKMGSIERHAFYETAKNAFAVVQTTENRPYGCFLLKKGVVFEG